MQRLPAPPRTLRAVYLAWVLIYAAVGGEVAWGLRPFVGSVYQPVVFLRSDALAGMPEVMRWVIYTSRSGKTLPGCPVPVRLSRNKARSLPG